MKLIDDSCVGAPDLYKYISPGINEEILGNKNEKFGQKLKMEMPAGHYSKNMPKSYSQRITGRHFLDISKRVDPKKTISKKY